MDIYYQIDNLENYHVEYVLDGEKVYDSLKSPMAFTSWIETEHSDAKLIEVTDENYQELRAQGKVC